MRELKKSDHASRFVPDFMATSLQGVDFKMLRQRGVKYVALDADSTLVAYRGTEIDSRTKRHLLRERKHIEGWCIASNRITNDLGELSESINAAVVPTSILVRKPKKRYFQRITKYFSAEPGEIAMIGDKLLADVWGGNRAGFITVWVEKLGDDGFHDRAFGVRKWEQYMIRKHT